MYISMEKKLSPSWTQKKVTRNSFVVWEKPGNSEDAKKLDTLWYLKKQQQVFFIHP